MLTIGAVAARTGLRASAIRYYESRGLLPVASRAAGKRVYDASVLARLAVIRLAKTAGFDRTKSARRCRASMIASLPRGGRRSPVPSRSRSRRKWSAS